MALTVSTLLSDAILQAHPFVSEYAVAKGPLVRTLERLDDKIVDTFFQNAPERLQASAADIPVVAATNPVGYALTAARAYFKWRWIDSGDGSETAIHITPGYENVVERHPSGQVKGSTFFPNDPWNQRWATSGARPYFSGTGDLIAYEYVPLSSSLTSLSSTLISPDEVSEYLVAELVFQIISNHNATPPLRLQQAVQEIKDQWTGLMQGMTKRTDMQSSFGLPRG